MSWIYSVFIVAAIAVGCTATEGVGDTNSSTVPAAHMVGFGVPTDLQGRAADGAEVWVDIQINDVARLGQSWRLVSATYTYVIEQFTARELPWPLANGDQLRFHGPAYTGGNDTDKEDNNADRWDFRGTETFGINIKHGFIWLEDSGGHMLDGVVYESGENDGDWLDGAAASALQNGVALGLWNSTSKADAFVVGDADVEFARLRDVSSDGDSAVDWQARGNVVEPYYADALGKTGNALKTALNWTLRGHSVIAYDYLPQAFRVTDRDPNDATRVIQFYTGHSTLDEFNREHIWAKSHGDFGSNLHDGYTDLHHLRPTREDVNFARWHLDFDEGGELLSDSGCRRLPDVSFEPRDVSKGDVARMIFYMAVRYEGGDGNMPDLELIEAIPSLLNANGEPDNGFHTSTPRFGRLSTLLRWHRDDPPDAEERRRNDVIFNDYQGNRNPFIDHPEWVEAIWGG